MSEPLSRGLIERNTVDFLRTAGGTRPDLRVVKLEDRTIVVKDYKRSDPLFRLIVGPILIRRESGALRKLKGVRGIAQIVARLDRYSLAIEHIPGASLEHVQPEALSNEFYRELREVVDGMHARGVAHCDLRSRGNVMLGDDGKPYIVDFAACVFRGRGINPFSRWLFGQFVLADRHAVLLAKRRATPHLLTEDEIAELETPLPYERPAKAFGETVRNITRKLLTRRKA